MGSHNASKSQNKKEKEIFQNYINNVTCVNLNEPYKSHLSNLEIGNKNNIHHRTTIDYVGNSISNKGSIQNLSNKLNDTFVNTNSKRNLLGNYQHYNSSLPQTRNINTR